MIEVAVIRVKMTYFEVQLGLGFPKPVGCVEIADLSGEVCFCERDSTDK